MRTTAAVTSLLLTLATLALSNAALAETGAGACVLGTGVSFYSSDSDILYAGVNVGLSNSTSGAYLDRAEYEAQCCAEGDMAPDCFRPAA